MSTSQPAQKGDLTTGMAHTEAHYFNSYNHHGPSCSLFAATA